MTILRRIISLKTGQTATRASPAPSAFRYTSNISSAYLAGDMICLAGDMICLAGDMLRLDGDMISLDGAIGVSFMNDEDR